MPTAATAQVTLHLPQSEAERIVRDGSRMRTDGMAAEEVERWVKAEISKAVEVR